LATPARKRLYCEGSGLSRKPI